MEVELSNEKRIVEALESIEKHLSTLAKDTKANKELRIENRDLFADLEKKIEDLAKNPFNLSD